MAGIILSADIGTSSLKAALIDLDGRIVAFSRQAYDPGASGLPDAGSWERAFARALEHIHAQAPACAPDGICVSGNGPTLAPLAKGGEALPPLYWHEGRKNPPQETSPDQEIPNPPRSFFLPHAAWLKENAPADYEKTTLFLSPHEWLSFRLGAQALAVLPSAAYEPYFWDDDQCRFFAVDRAKFPPFVKMGSVIGTVSAEAAALFACGGASRLRTGTPIIAGGTDFIAALVGTGTLKPGDVCDRAGSSEGINICAAICAAICDAKPAAGSGIRALPHVKEGLWNVGKIIPSSGRLFESYRRASGQEHLSYEAHLAELIPSAADTGIFKNIAPLAPDAPLLHSAQEPLLHSVQELGRSVLCAIGLAVRDAAAALERHGFPVKEMKVSGGQAKNARWNQLKADMTGITLIIPEIPDGELAGNAVISAVALGSAGSLEEAAAKMIRAREVYEPQPAAAAFWDDRFKTV